MPEIDVLSFENCAGSDFRELLLKRAKDAYANGDKQSSIFYQIKSLCTGFDSYYSFRKEEIAIKATTFTKEEKLRIEKNPLLKYAMNYLKGKRQKHQEPLEHPVLDNIQNSSDGMKRVHEICLSMPQEWTVIQMCKEQCENTTYSTFREVFATDAAIYLSILKHPRSLEYPDVICLRLTAENQAALFEKCSVLTSLFSEYGSYSSEEKDLASYWAGMAILESRVADAIAELKTFIGPWVSLLCGNVKPKYRDRQRSAFKAVDLFCDANGLGNQQRVLLSLLAQQRHLLTDEHIQQASIVLCSPDPEDDEVVDNTTVQLIYDFLTQFPSEAEIAFGPCIMILDERIDHFYWETLNPCQELCRMSSFNILVRLYERYKSQMKNGYLMFNVENGRCVVDPDCNLQNTQERMRSFFNYWLPHWKAKYKVVPTIDEFMEIFNEADCYVYCGHGSGLQYINCRKLSKFQLKCVVFLFGCDSVRLRSQGLHSEMVGSHLYYHAALCPAVVGTLQLGFDFQVDKIASTLLSQWIPTKKQDIIHWHYIDKPSWKKGTIKPIDTKSTKTLADHYEGSLAKAVCNIHQQFDQKLYNTVGFVYRGLPAWNSNNSYLN